MCVRRVHDWMEWRVRADHMDVCVRRWRASLGGVRVCLEGAEV